MNDLLFIWGTGNNSFHYLVFLNLGDKLIKSQDNRCTQRYNSFYLEKNGALFYCDLGWGRERNSILNLEEYGKITAHKFFPKGPSSLSWLIWYQTSIRPPLDWRISPKAAWFGWWSDHAKQHGHVWLHWRRNWRNLPLWALPFHWEDQWRKVHPHTVYHLQRQSHGFYNEKLWRKRKEN